MSQNIRPAAGRYYGRPFNDQGGTKNVVTRDAPWEGRGDKVFGTNLGVPQAACLIIIPQDKKHNLCLLVGSHEEVLYEECHK